MKGVNIMLFDLKNVPRVLHNTAQYINNQASILMGEIEDVQNKCEHSWEKVTRYDPKYSPFVDGRHFGSQVIFEFCCSICNRRKPIEGEPYTVCRMCGGNMKHDRFENCGGARVNVNKCRSCGHEYDTT